MGDIENLDLSKTIKVSARTASTKESVLETYLINLVKQYGGSIRKFIAPGHRGVPDRIIFYRGAHFVELKKGKGGVLSNWQKQEIQLLDNAGVSVSVISTEAEAEELMASLTDDKIPKTIICTRCHNHARMYFTQAELNMKANYTAIQKAFLFKKICPDCMGKAGG